MSLGIDLNRGLDLDLDLELERLIAKAMYRFYSL
jgi:hypothetical protein